MERESFRSIHGLNDDGSQDGGEVVLIADLREDCCAVVHQHVDPHQLLHKEDEERSSQSASNLELGVVPEQQSDVKLVFLLLIHRTQNLIANVCNFRMILWQVMESS